MGRRKATLRRGLKPRGSGEALRMSMECRRLPRAPRKPECLANMARPSRTKACRGGRTRRNELYPCKGRLSRGMDGWVDTTPCPRRATLLFGVMHVTSSSSPESLARLWEKMVRARGFVSMKPPAMNARRPQGTADWVAMVWTSTLVAWATIVSTARARSSLEGVCAWSKTREAADGTKHGTWETTVPVHRLHGVSRRRNALFE